MSSEEKKDILIDKLLIEIQKLKERLSKFENKKNSKNSSVPPSQDPNRLRKTKSLRQKSGKKPGGQKGHEGSTLQMVATPDEVVKLSPDFCNRCGSSLSNTPSEYLSKRQIADIPPIDVKYTEYQIYKTTCACGCENKSEFPSGVNSPISYGPNIQSHIAYLHTRQYVPYQRMEELFGSIFNVKLRQGTINNIIAKMAGKAMPVYDNIRQRLEKSAVVGVDETGAIINGDLNWAWTWQAENLTYITFSDNRGSNTIKSTFPTGLPNSILVNDHWKAHYNTGAKTHQMCTAHLLRDLNHISELYNNPVSKKIKNLFLKAINLERNMKVEDYHKNNKEVIEIKDIFEQLIKNDVVDNKHKLLQTFINRMRKFRKYIFTFLEDPLVPPDNNASERAIRNIKVKQKISGQFKNIENANYFAILRSIIDTTLKNGNDVFQALRLIAMQNDFIAE